VPKKSSDSLVAASFIHLVVGAALVLWATAALPQGWATTTMWIFLFSLIPWVIVIAKRVMKMTQ